MNLCYICTMSKIIIFLILCNLTLSITANPFYISRIGQQDGLSNGYIMGIAQDRKGFIWFSTESGLNRYDGTQFRVYRKTFAPGESTAISGNELNNIYADKFDDILWIATQRDGLNAFHTGTEEFIHYKHDANNASSLITDDVTDVTNSRDGNLWVTTYWRGLEYLDKATGAFTHFNTETMKGLVSNNIWSVAESADGTIFLGHVNDGLTIYSPATQQIRNFRADKADPRSIPGNQVFKVFIDKNGNLWVGTDKGLALFNTATERFTVFRHDPHKPHSLISNGVFDIMQDTAGRLWVGTENGGVSVLDLRNEMFLSPGETTFINIYPGTTHNSLSNKTVRRLFQDHFGNIWIGTYGDGINFISYRKPPFHVYSTLSPDAPLSDNIVMALCTDRQDRLWVGTDNSGIDVIHNGVKRVNYHAGNSSLSDNAIIAAFRDSRDNLWFGSFMGDVNFLDAATDRLIPVPVGIPHDIRCFAENDGKQIVIGHGGGITIYNPADRSAKNYSRREGNLREDQVRSILIDTDGKVWVGSFGDGLTIYDRKMDELRHFTLNQNFPSNRVNHLMGDRAGNVWAATGNGLVLFSTEGKGESFKVFDTDKGLSDSHIRAIAEDAAGNIWVSTLSGISVLDKKEQRFYNYDHAYGVPSGDFLSGSVTTTTDGQIYFGSHFGLCMFNPMEVTTSIDLSPVVITDFHVHRRDNINDSETRLPVMPEMKLDYADNSFKVSFGVLDNSLSKLTEYAYQLDGFDSRWYDTRGENSIIFRNLPPGDYRLHIRSRIHNQEWGAKLTSLPISVLPPLWSTWWAKLLYLLTAAALLFSLVRFYQQRLLLKHSLLLEKQDHYREQSLNAERMRFFTNITHELRTPLTLILGPLGDLSGDQALTQKQHRKISLIRNSANRLLDLINTILEFRKTETQNKQLAVRYDNLETLIHEIGFKYKELNTNESVRYETVIEEGDYHLFFDPEMISTIVENLLSNAGKYCETGSVTLRLHHTEESGVPFTEITVADTGVGIHAEALPQIFDHYYQDMDNKHRMGTGIGLALVYNLVKLHEGEIFVESELYKGSLFRFRIHTDNRYPHALHINESVNDMPLSLEMEEVILQDEVSTQKSKPKILVVEDNLDMVHYIEESLSESYVIYTAANGKTGLEKARTLMPDLLVSDIMMPVMDGVEMMRLLKKDVLTSHLPVILLTAKDSMEDRAEAYETGAESFISKPFTARLLQSRIANLLDTRRQLIERIKNASSMIDKAEIMASSLSALDSEFIRKIEALIIAHIESETLDVKFIAEKMYMSHSTLYRKVKAVTGMTVNGLVRKIRVREAEKLLLERRHTISAIAMMVGINSPVNFRQSFREEFGLSPSDYLKSIREHKDD